MKSFMVSSMTWGILLILFGLAILIKALFGIDIPLFRIMCGCGLVYWGVSMITNLTVYTPKKPHQENVRFSAADITASRHDSLKREYNNVFGKLNLTLADTIILKKPHYLKMRTVFGATELSIPHYIPAQIHIMAMFGSTEVENRGHVSFSEKTIYIGPQQQNPLLIIDIETVFGSCIVRQSF